MVELGTSCDEAARGKLSDRLATCALAAAAVCVALYALTSLALPFGWDHGIIASVGSSYVHGGLPYVDSWDMKGPAAYLPFALAEWLFGPTMWGVRLIDLAIWGVGGFVLYDGVRRETNARIGFGVALVTYLWIASAGWFFSADPECWVTVCCVLGIIPVLAPGRTLKLHILALSGAFIACAGLVKAFYFGFGLSPLLALILAGDLTWGRRVALAAALALGALLPPVLLGGYFALHGGLAQAIEVHLLYPLSAYVGSSTGLLDVLHGVKPFLVQGPIIFSAPLVLAGLWLRRTQTRLLAILLAWIAVTLLCVALQGKYFVYHWFPLYPPLFALAGIGAFELLRANTRPVAAALAAVCSLGVIVSAAAQPAVEVAKYTVQVLLKHDPQRYYASYDFRLYNAGDEIAAARYIAARTRPDQGLYIWGSDATVSYLAQRPNPTRFTFSMPLTLPGAFREAYRVQAMRQISARPPAYFVVGISWDGLADGAQSLADFPAMNRFLSERYVLEKRIGILKLYRLRDAPKTPTGLS